MTINRTKLLEDVGAAKFNLQLALFKSKERNDQEGSNSYLDVAIGEIESKNYYWVGGIFNNCIYELIFNFQCCTLLLSYFSAVVDNLHTNQGPRYVLVENEGNRRFFVQGDDVANTPTPPQSGPRQAVVVPFDGTPPPPLEGDDDKFDFFNPEDSD